MTGVESQMLQALHVQGAVMADGGHDKRVSAEQSEIVGDIPGASSKLAPHVGNEKGNIENVNLLGQNVVLETIMKNHDRVIGDGAANQCFHGEEASI